jgi:hypothetical protein
LHLWWSNDINNLIFFQDLSQKKSCKKNLNLTIKFS